MSSVSVQSSKFLYEKIDFPFILVKLIVDCSLSQQTEKLELGIFSRGYHLISRIFERCVGACAG